MEESCLKRFEVSGMTPNRLVVEFERIAPLLTGKGREELRRRLEENSGRLIINLWELLSYVSRIG